MKELIKIGLKEVWCRPLEDKEYIRRNDISVIPDKNFALSSPFHESWFGRTASSFNDENSIVWRPLKRPAKKPAPKVKAVRAWISKRVFWPRRTASFDDVTLYYKQPTPSYDLERVLITPIKRKAGKK